MTPQYRSLPGSTNSQRKKGGHSVESTHDIWPHLYTEVKILGGAKDTGGPGRSRSWVEKLLRAGDGLSF